jgi:hypothetical protein
MVEPEGGHSERSLENLNGLSSSELSKMKRATPHLFKLDDNKYEFYKTDVFWSYVDAYAAYVKDNQEAIDFYVNVDAIFNPEISWSVLKYLEKEHGLSPLPVIHYGTPLKWIERHLNAGYQFIGLGGLGQEAQKTAYYAWADKVYNILCPGPNNLPVVKTHGFAMTAWDLMVRYPWWSVDSASWAKAGGFGTIYTPQMRGGEFSFKVRPLVLGVSALSPKAKTRGHHLNNVSVSTKRQVMEWLEHLKIPLGSVNAEGEMVEWGVASHHAARKIANLKYFEAMRKSLPEWPWPFRKKAKRDNLFGR